MGLHLLCQFVGYTAYVIMLLITASDIVWPAVTASFAMQAQGEGFSRLPYAFLLCHANPHVLDPPTAVPSF